MSNRQDTNVRIIHPKALAETNEQFCLAALEVARDLRSGVIPPTHYDQNSYCGTACCIGGHIAKRIGIHPEDISFMYYRNMSLIKAYGKTGNLYALFSPISKYVDGTPESAANAIERYVYEGSETPWKE